MLRGVHAHDRGAPRPTHQVYLRDAALLQDVAEVDAEDVAEEGRDLGEEEVERGARERQPAEVRHRGLLDGHAAELLLVRDALGDVLHHADEPLRLARVAEDYVDARDDRARRAVRKGKTELIGRRLERLPGPLLHRLQKLDVRHRIGLVRVDAEDAAELLGIRALPGCEVDLPTPHVGHALRLGELFLTLAEAAGGDRAHVPFPRSVRDWERDCHQEPETTYTLPPSLKIRRRA